MKRCYICDTPYQLLNCINHYYHKQKGVDFADIYIGNQFYKCKEIAENLKKECCFHGVYSYEFPHYTGLKSYFNSRKSELFTISKSLDEWTHYNNNLSTTYDEIYMSIYSHFSFGVKQINPKAEVIFYDDGIGTYLGRAQIINFKKRKLLYRILSIPFPELEPSKIYLNNVRFYSAINKLVDGRIEEFSRITKGDTDFINMLYRVFKLSNEKDYDTHDLIFLTQPDDDLRKNHEIIEKKILNNLSDYKERTLLRVHPRQYDYDFGIFKADRERSIWELVVLNKVNNNSVLLSVFSTAQFVPKVMFNYEPILIFTYFLHKEGYSDLEIRQMNKAVNSLKDIYINKDKVYVVKSFLELSEVLKIVTNRIEETT